MDIKKVKVIDFPNNVINNYLFKRLEELSKVEQLKVKYSIKLILEVLNIYKSLYYLWKNKINKFNKIIQKFIIFVKRKTLSEVWFERKHLTIIA